MQIERHGQHLTHRRLDVACSTAAGTSVRASNDRPPSHVGPTPRSHRVCLDVTPATVFAAANRIASLRRVPGISSLDEDLANLIWSHRSGKVEALAEFAVERLEADELLGLLDALCNDL